MKTIFIKLKTLQVIPSSPFTHFFPLTVFINKKYFTCVFGFLLLLSLLLLLLLFDDIFFSKIYQWEAKGV
jgi:hypothetical protein